MCYIGLSVLAIFGGWHSFLLHWSLLVAGTSNWTSWRRWQQKLKAFIEQVTFTLTFSKFYAMQYISTMLWILRDQFKWLHKGLIIYDTSNSDNIYETVLTSHSNDFVFECENELKAASKSSLNTIYHVWIKVTETLTENNIPSHFCYVQISFEFISFFFFPYFLIKLNNIIIHKIYCIWVRWQPLAYKN